MSNILVLHGPNLNLLGKREKQHYGSHTLDEINQRLLDIASKSNCSVICKQSNVESELLNEIHSASISNIHLIIFNPAAYTHTSVVLRDALLAVDIPFIEVHISNIYKREEWRSKSYFSDIAIGSITGFGSYSYDLALEAGINYLTRRQK